MNRKGVSMMFSYRLVRLIESHADALAAHGLTPLHRLSFAPVRSRSLFPADLEEQMDLFDNMAMRACR